MSGLMEVSAELVPTVRTAVPTIAPTAVRVAVRSPEPVVAAGLTALLGRHEERVRVVASTAGADVVLYDVLALLDGGEAELVAAVRDPGCTVIAFDRGTCPELLARTLALGAAASLSLSVSAPELVDAVERASRRELVRDAGLPDNVHARLAAEVGLTEREISVLTLIARGYTNLEIAGELYLSINSIKTYIRMAYRKIGATRRGQAVNWALRHGFPLVDASPDPGR